MDHSLKMRQEDLVNNPTPRLPICLCLDTSGTMGAVDGDYLEETGETYEEDGHTWNVVIGGTTRMEELLKGVQLFYDEIRADEIAQYSAEICIVTFNDKAECVFDFANIERQPKLPEFEPCGETCMGEGVNMALDLLERRKQEYKDKGVDYYQPWLVLMTDGEPTGSTVELKRAMERTCEMVNNKKLTLFPIGIGAEAKMDILRKFSPKWSPIKLKGLKFKEFFTWLSQSVARTSQSTPGEKVPLPDYKGWGYLE